MTTTIIEKTKDGSFIRYLSKPTKKERARVSIYTKKGNKDIKRTQKTLNNSLSASTVTAGDYYV